MRERRKFHRIRFAEPLRSRVRARRVAMLDLSVAGACIQHHTAMKPGSAIDIEIEHSSELIRLVGIVTRCQLSHYSAGSKPEAVYHSGVRFDGIEESNLRRLEALLAEFEERAVEEAKRIGGGELPAEIGAMPIQVWLRNKLK